MNHFLDIIFYNRYLFFNKYDKIFSMFEPKEFVCWEISGMSSLSLFFVIESLAVAFDIDGHYFFYSLMFFSCSINYLLGKKFIDTGRYKKILKEKPQPFNSRILGGLISVIAIFLPFIAMLRVFAWVAEMNR